MIRIIHFPFIFKFPNLFQHLINLYPFQFNPYSFQYLINPYPFQYLINHYPFQFNSYPFQLNTHPFQYVVLDLIFRSISILVINFLNRTKKAS